MLDRGSASIVLALLLSAVPGRADSAADNELPAIPVGTRVRLHAPEVDKRAVIGSLLATSDRDLIVFPEGRNDPIVIPRDTVRALDVSQGLKSKRKGALIGAGIGATAGALLGVAAATSSCEPGSALEAFACAVIRDSFREPKTSLVLGGVGLGLGALIGAAVTHGERWQAVPISRVTLRASNTPRGMAVEVHFAF
jgi:hypothetical protein